MIILKQQKGRDKMCDFLDKIYLSIFVLKCKASYMAHRAKITFYVHVFYIVLANESQQSVSFCIICILSYILPHQIDIVTNYIYRQNVCPSSLF